MSKQSLVEPVQLEDGAQLTPLEPDEFPAAMDCLEEAFPKTPRGFFYAITHNDPGYQPGLSLAVRKGRRVLSFLQIFPRVLMLQGAQLPFGGIGSVGTRPESRGRGYASALLDYSLGVMRQHGMRGAMLFTSIQSFYEKQGWQVLERYEQSLSVEPLRMFRSHEIETVPLTAEDANRLLMLYQAQGESRTAWFPRSLDYWRQRATWMSHPGWIVKRNGEMQGYMYACQFQANQPILSITECGVQPGDDQAIETMLGAMAEKAEALRCHTLRGFFHLQPELYNYLKEHEQIGALHPHRYMMWRDLSAQDAYFATLQQAAHSRQFLYWTTDAF